ncbi:hypothetical protein QJS10_CPB18g00690 [Acorus calamus]|uniref:Uncharacterized protein n=1 Tax=Acorus calamus TaxID=4465 RepID=A0AAV9CNI3_ACOCL|nr:hypothetical protein QJS10_CPB18g00690 [Acorus calamus]
MRLSSLHLLVYMEKDSITSVKCKGDNGSPWRRPKKAEKKPSRDQLMRTGNLGVSTHSMHEMIHFFEKLKPLRTSSRELSALRLNIACLTSSKEIGPPKLFVFLAEETSFSCQGGTILQMSRGLSIHKIHIERVRVE